MLCRYHNADDLIATVLAVQPMKLIYRGRIAIFSINVLKDERIVKMSINSIIIYNYS